MKTETVLLLIGAGVLLYFWDQSKTKLPSNTYRVPVGDTGVLSIGGGGGPLLPCCDDMGNIVDAGNSVYCPEGTTVDYCTS